VSNSLRQTPENVQSRLDDVDDRAVRPDDLSREVFGVLGVPVDALDLRSLLAKVEQAVKERARLLLSTPNVNYLMMSRESAAFRESLILSDLCSADGMPIVWIARMLGIPITERLSGSDLFDHFKRRRKGDRRLRVFLFGGGEGVAATLSNTLNTEVGAMHCVGTLNPGFGSVEDMSQPHIIEAINATDADVLVVFLSAKKAQAWLRHNHEGLKIPVRANFGATINFQVGKTKRAPVLLRKAGLEWLWRIKEEPYLWRRYWQDGTGLLYLIMTCVLPLAVHTVTRRLLDRNDANEFQVDQKEDDDAITIHLSGRAIARNVDKAVPCFQKALRDGKHIFVDLSAAQRIDPRFFGLFLVLRRGLAGHGRQLNFVGIDGKIRRAFRLNGFEFLLEEQPTIIGGLSGRTIAEINDGSTV
jgi:N-acetylglucosaminyldiphosphoundecaprenol N-acetyl-beta-D-mannosaminyltransferase